MVPKGGGAKLVVRARAAHYTSDVAGDRLSLDQFALVTARLQSGMSPDEALADLGFDGDRWLAEQQRWLAKVAEMAADGHVALHVALTEKIQQHVVALERLEDQRSRTLEGEHPVAAERMLSPIAHRTNKPQPTAVEREPVQRQKSAVRRAADLLPVEPPKVQIAVAPAQRPWSTAEMPKFEPGQSTPFAEMADADSDKEKEQRREEQEAVHDALPFEDEPADTEPLPQREARSDPLMRTLEGASAPEGSALPFPELSGVTKTFAAVGDGTVLPFRPAPSRAEMTVEQYAWLSSMLDAAPAQADEILERAQLTKDDKRALDDYFTAKLMNEPAVRARYLQACAKFSKAGQG